MKRKLQRQKIEYANGEEEAAQKIAEGEQKIADAEAKVKSRCSSGESLQMDGYS